MACTTALHSLSVGTFAVSAISRRPTGEHLGPAQRWEDSSAVGTAAQRAGNRVVAETLVTASSNTAALPEDG
jgi:hypothetical protein